jgi:hypothetical protein
VQQQQQKTPYANARQNVQIGAVICSKKGKRDNIFLTPTRAEIIILFLKLTQKTSENDLFPVKKCISPRKHVF